MIQVQNSSHLQRRTHVSIKRIGDRASYDLYVGNLYFHADRDDLLQSIGPLLQGDTRIKGYCSAKQGRPESWIWIYRTVLAKGCIN
jgi:hypothetical protein